MEREKQNLKTLCDIIDPEPSGDESEETQFDIGLIRSEQYDLLEIHTYFGTEEFMNIFRFAINSVKFQEISIQASLCRALLQKIEEIYNFDFQDSIQLLNQGELNQVYNLAEFLQYNHLDFITNIWKHLNIKNVININVVNLFSQNKDKFNTLIEQITNTSLMYGRNTLINKFLNTCDKDTALFMINDMTNKWKIEITANLMKGYHDDNIG